MRGRSREVAGGKYDLMSQKKTQKAQKLTSNRPLNIPSITQVCNK